MYKLSDHFNTSYQNQFGHGKSLTLDEIFKMSQQQNILEKWATTTPIKEEIIKAELLEQEEKFK